MSDSLIRYHDLLNEIKIATQTAQRPENIVNLIAVSKTYEKNDILPILNAGQRLFGENRVQEAKQKWPELRNSYENIELHLIGPLQSNKAAEAVALFDVIQTVDRFKIVDAIHKEMTAQKRYPRIFVQINTGSEPQKAGIEPKETEHFLAYCKQKGMKIDGLMCIPPIDEEPMLHFSLLTKIADRFNLPARSMGMSSDYEAAIKCGATHIRVGSAIFGPRN